MRRPCLEPTCSAVSIKGGSRCGTHLRDRNLARDMMDTILLRDRYICRLCNDRIDPGLRGAGRGASPSLHHLHGTSDHPSNLAATHLDCNKRAH